MRRYSEKERSKILRAYARFDGSQARFCRESGVSVGRLQNWLRSQRTGFLEVHPAPGGQDAVTLRAAGAEIAFATPPDPEYLAQVLRALA